MRFPIRERVNPMNNGILCLLSFCLVGTVYSLPKEKFETFNNLIMDGKTMEADSLIGKENQNDAEIVLLRLNSIFKQGRQSKVIIAQGEAKKGDLSLTKTDDPKVKGFIRDTVVIDSLLLKNGFDRFEKDIAGHASRLNLHMSYLHYLLAFGFYDRIDRQMDFFMKTSKANGNKWFTLYGEAVSDSEESFLLDFQTILGNLFRKETVEADELVLRHGKQAIANYPKSKYAYNILGALYGANKDYDEAVKYLKKGNEIDNKDKTIIGNIIEMYKRSGDEKNRKIWQSRL